MGPTAGEHDQSAEAETMFEAAECFSFWSDRPTAIIVSLSGLVYPMQYAAKASSACGIARGHIATTMPVWSKESFPTIHTLSFWVHVPQLKNLQHPSPSHKLLLRYNNKKGREGCRAHAVLLRPLLSNERKQQRGGKMQGAIDRP